MKKVKAELEKSNPEKVTAFMANAKEMVGWVLKKFDEFQL